MPKAIFYLLKGDYNPYEKSLARLAGGSTPSEFEPHLEQQHEPPRCAVRYGKIQETPPSQ